MSFVTTQPAALTAAASNLQAIGSALGAQNAAAAGPTTGVTPAGADEVSALMAAQFSTHGSMYQEVSAQAAAIHQMLVNTLGTNAESYAATEAANAAVASTPAAAAGQSAIGTMGGIVNALGSNALVSDLGEGASTATMYIPSSLVPSMIGFLTSGGAGAGGATAGSGLGALLAPGGPLGALGGLGGGVGAASSAAAVAPAVTGVMGQASLVNSLSVPPSWAAATPASAAPAAALPSAGWAVAPESNSIAAMPGGMPGGGSGRGGFGFGAPRYGVKPTVMPRPVVVG
jgi:PPE-repeat protein